MLAQKWRAFGVSLLVIALKVKEFTVKVVTVMTEM